MTDKLLSIRLSTEEYQVLKAMAKREVRTANSWLRSRIVQEGRELGLLNDGINTEMNQEDIPMEYYTPPTYEEFDL